MDTAPKPFWMIAGIGQGCPSMKHDTADKAAEADSLFLSECRADRGHGSFAKYLTRWAFIRRIVAGLWTGIGMYVLWSAAK